VVKQFTLGKQERLKSRKAIEQLFKDGQRFTITPYRVFYRKAGKPGLQFGAGVSSKNFKKAVDRNRVKRLMREAYRLQKINLQKHLKDSNTGLNLFFIYTGKELPSYDIIYEKMALALQKLTDSIEQ